MSAKVKKSIDGCGLEAVKELLGSQLQAPDQLKQPEGAATGLERFDSGTLWGGFPKGEMTLLLGELGAGATSLWIGAAQRVLQARKWAAWIDGPAPLCPTPLRHRGLDLSRLLVTQTNGGQPLAWLRLARELLSSTLFETIGSAAPEALLLRESQARKLLAACRSANVAFVLVARGKPPPYLELFALVARFESKRILIERALHRRPFEIPRRISHANFVHARFDENPLLAPGKTGDGRGSKQE